MPGLDTSAWFVPDGGFAGAIGQSPYADSPGIGIRLSEISLANSIASLNVEYSPQTYQGNPSQNGPGTLPLAGGTMMWNRMQLLYGTVEVRAKLIGPGIHPTIWLFDARARSSSYAQTPNTPASVPAFAWELDIAEGVPFVYGNTTTLRQNIFGPSDFQNVLTTTVSDYSANWHTYKVVWTPSSVTWFVDGVQTNQVSSGIPNMPMFLIIDIEAADAGSGDVVQANFPQVLEVDYVRAWDQGNNLVFSDDFTGAPAVEVNKMSNLSFLQAVGADGTIGADSSTIEYPSPVTSDSYLVLYALVISPGAVSDVTSVTDSLGNIWEPVRDDHNASGHTVVWHVPVSKPGGGANTVTINFSNAASQSNLKLALLEYTNQFTAGSSPVDTSNSQHDSTGTSYSGTPVTTEFTNETILVFGYTTDNTQGPNGTNGWVGRPVTGLGGEVNFGLMDLDTTAPGTYTPTATFSASEEWAPVTLAIKSTSSGDVYDATIPFIGSIRIVGSAPAGASNPFVGTVKVLASIPSGPPNPYLGNAVIGTPSAGDSNPVLGQVSVVGSAPAGDSDPFLGQVEEA